MKFSRKLISTAGLALFSFSIIACAGPTKKEPIAAPNLKAELHRAEIDFNAGSNKNALSRLHKITTQHAETDAADDAHILMGQIYFKLGSFTESYRSFIAVINSEFFSPREVDASLGAAKSLEKLGRYDEALTLTTRALKNKSVSEETNVELYGLRYQLQTVLGERLEALRSLVFLGEKSADKQVQERFRIRALELVDSRLKIDELEKVSSDPEYGFVRSHAQFRVGLEFFEQRDYSRAERYFRGVVSADKDSELALEAANFIEQIEARRRVSPDTIGAVLPLTGKHAAIAQKSLRGLQMGLGIADGSSPYKIAVIDSGANADIARRGVERLVIEDSVIGVVGDILSKTADAVARKGDELGVPVIGLSQKSGLTEVGENVFRNALTSGAMIDELVRTAMDQYGMRRFAILFPNDAYGVEYANLFWDAVVSRGGKITAAQSYSANEKDFNGPVSRLVGTFYLEDRADEYSNLVKNWYSEQKAITSRVVPPTDLLPPIIDFDAIFIPDSVKALGQIASMLKYNDVKQTVLLGTNLWNNSSLVERGTSLVEGALFVDSRISVDPDFQKTSFFSNYRALYGEDPSAFDVQGYDAGLALRYLIDRGSRSRVSLRESLAALEGVPGAFGDLRVTPMREFVRPLSVLTVIGGKIEVARGPIQQKSD